MMVKMMLIYLWIENYVCCILIVLGIQLFFLNFCLVVEEVVIDIGQFDDCVVVLFLVGSDCVYGVIEIEKDVLVVVVVDYGLDLEE